MTEPVHKKWASVYFNGDFYIASSSSGYRSCVRDPLGFEGHLAPTATDEELGKVLLEAVAQSRFLRPEQREEFDQLFNPMRIAASYETWVDSLLERYKYKTKRDLFRNMALCNITVIANEVEIFPMRHEKLESWAGLKGEGIEGIVLPLGSSHELLGKALRIAFDRCK